MLVRAALAAAFLGLTVVVPSVAAPTQASSSTLSGARIASFWAQPYPYGYRWRFTPCIRKVCATRVRVLGNLIDPAMPLSGRDG